MNVKKYMICPAIVTVAILLIPLVAMQFTEEVDWGYGDFAVIGVLVFLTGVGVELAIKKISSQKHQVVAVVILLLTCLAIWGELAVNAVSQILTLTLRR